MLCPTPESRLCDAQGRPYFLWDNDLTLPEFLVHLRAEDEEVRAYWLGKLMRQAKPDDAIVIAGIDPMRRLWPKLERYLGRTRAFWTWYLDWAR
jgi:hypothetical protein